MTIQNKVITIAPQAVAVGVVAANNNLGFVAFIKNQAPGLR